MATGRPINPEALSSDFKISGVSITYKDGRLVGVNAEAQDQVGELMKMAAVAGAGVPGGWGGSSGKAKCCFNRHNSEGPDSANCIRAHPSFSGGA